MTPSMRNVFGILCCVCLCSSAKAQHFLYQASLDTVLHSGFYQIPLTSDIGQHTQADYRDIRIFDQQHQQVPYLINTQFSTKDSMVFRPLIILQNQTIDSNRSELIFRDPDTVPLHALSIQVGNTNSQRLATLSGSGDGKQWFTIAENISIEGQPSPERNYFVKDLQIPSSNCAFYRLLINNEKKDPLHILSVGKYTWHQSPISHRWTTNPPLIFHQVDSSDGISYLHVENGPSYHVERIVLHVKGPTYFKRTARLIVDSAETTTTRLSSDSSLYIDCLAFTSPAWSLEIENGDNPPLEVTDLITQLQSTSLVAYLEAGKMYHVDMGSLDASLPQYDLGDFRNRIPDSLPILKVTTVGHIPYVDKVIQPNWFNQRWLWIILIGVLLLLSLFTFRLVREIKK
jgi:hypothetical protein